MAALGSTVSETGCVPILFRSAISRKSTPEIPGAYDSELLVWAVSDGSRSLPIVEADANDILRIVTKTKVELESDDDEWSGVGDLHAGCRASNVLLEITTKTYAQIESEDHQPTLYLLEISTKTATNGEDDDEISDAGNYI